MTYPLMCAVFLAAALVIALFFGRGNRPDVRALLLAALALTILTTVFDTVMIAAGFTDYDHAHLSGLWIWGAPIEDFAYPAAALILLPALWSHLRSRDDR